MPLTARLRQSRRFFFFIGSQFVYVHLDLFSTFSCGLLCKQIQFDFSYVNVYDEPLLTSPVEYTAVFRLSTIRLFNLFHFYLFNLNQYLPRQSYPTWENQVIAYCPDQVAFSVFSIVLSVGFVCRFSTRNKTSLLNLRIPTLLSHFSFPNANKNSSFPFCQFACPGLRVLDNRAITFLELSDRPRQTRQWW